MLTMSNQIPWTNSLIPIQLFSIIFYFFFLGQEWEVFNSKLKLGKSKQKHDSHSPSISSEIFFNNPTSFSAIIFCFLAEQFTLTYCIQLNLHMYFSHQPLFSSGIHTRLSCLIRQKETIFKLQPNHQKFLSRESPVIRVIRPLITLLIIQTFQFLQIF